ncbi:hypothetical protein CEXT_257961 [Caerostris extrusa]|uniref:Uncharacterized protein n=1 Tax=Caerostris extrusa TaxID=172846 RepID=A0AAV4VJ47_CAEEX|nr:hypothetical protein CEXT_257961 [Caerostris extrusa]
MNMTSLPILPPSTQKGFLPEKSFYHVIRKASLLSYDLVHFSTKINYILCPRTMEVPSIQTTTLLILGCRQIYSPQYFTPLCFLKGVCIVRDYSIKTPWETYTGLVAIAFRTQILMK